MFSQQIEYNFDIRRYVEFAKSRHMAVCYNYFIHLTLIFPLGSPETKRLNFQINHNSYKHIINQRKRDLDILIRLSNNESITLDDYDHLMCEEIYYVNNKLRELAWSLIEDEIFSDVIFYQGSFMP